VRPASIVAFTLTLLAAPAARAQTKPRDGAKIICPLLPSSKLIKKVKPVYPELAKQAHIEGKVSLQCIIGTDGAVEKIEVKEGPALLVEAATKAVSQWKYKPARLNGKAVQVETVVDVIFQLPKAQTDTDPY
jgi:TonB family protein